MEVLIIPTMLLVLVGFLATVAALAFYVLWPMVKALKDNRFTAIPRVYVIDIVSLLVLLQISMALFGMQLYFAAIPLAIAVLYAWWRGAGALSRLGIRDSGRRAAFLMFVMPWAVLGSLVAVVAGMIAFMSLAEGRYADPQATTISFLIWTTFLGSAGLFPLARWLCRWVVAGATTPET